MSTTQSNPPPQMVCCAYDNRPGNWAAVLALARSFSHFNPGLRLILHVPGAEAGFVSLLNTLPGVSASDADIASSAGAYGMKPYLLLSLLERHETVMWIDTDVVVAGPIEPVLSRHDASVLITAQEWMGPRPMTLLTQRWGWPVGRAVPRLNSAVLRVNRSHRALLLAWAEAQNDPRYVQAQSLSRFADRPLHLQTDQEVLSALLGSEGFAAVPYEQLSRHDELIHNAGLSGYRPWDRVRATLGLSHPILVHAIGRKPWNSAHRGSSVKRWLLKLEADLSVYTLHARRWLRDEYGSEHWVRPQTSLAAVLRAVCFNHPSLSGLPTAVIHAAVRAVARG